MADGKSESISLRVAKAIPSDVGHGRARISGENELDLKPGDIIEIKGENRTTAAIYWRSRPEDVKMDLHSLNAGEQQDEIEMILSEVTEIESLLKK